MIQITLRRISQTSLGTFGVLLNGDKQLCCTCERPWLDNKPDVSCVPPGSYVFTKYESPTKGQVWITQEVPGRSNIEIHSANWPFQLEGCIGVGDGYLRDALFTIIGVADSRNTLDLLRGELADEFTLVVEESPDPENTSQESQ
jgi:hypothetical protein